MTEADIINGLVGSGGSITAVGILALMWNRASKAKDASQQIVTQMLKADQATREKHTEVLTKLTSAIDEFNRVNGSNQRECSSIREAYSAEVTRLAAITEGCKKNKV